MAQRQLRKNVQAERTSPPNTLGIGFLSLPKGRILDFEPNDSAKRMLPIARACIYLAAQLMQDHAARDNPFECTYRHYGRAAPKVATEYLLAFRSHEHARPETQTIKRPGSHENDYAQNLYASRS